MQGILSRYSESRTVELLFYSGTSVARVFYIIYSTKFERDLLTELGSSAVIDVHIARRRQNGRSKLIQILHVSSSDFKPLIGQTCELRFQLPAYIPEIGSFDQNSISVVQTSTTTRPTHPNRIQRHVMVLFLTLLTTFFCVVSSQCTIITPLDSCSLDSHQQWLWGTKHNHNRDRFRLR